MLEQLFQTGLIFADVRIDLAVGALEICIAHQSRAAVPRTRNVNHVEVMLFNDPVQMHVDEILPWNGSPVSDHKRLHMRELQRFPQQRIVVEIDLPNCQVICGTPIGVHLPQQFGSKGLCSRIRERRGI